MRAWQQLKTVGNGEFRHKSFGSMRKKLVPEEKPICNAVAVFRARGNYLQRLEQFEKAIQAYNEALRWNGSDVRSLLGRSVARAKATHYAGALADAARAAANKLLRNCNGNSDANATGLARRERGPTWGIDYSAGGVEPILSYYRYLDNKKRRKYLFSNKSYLCVLINAWSEEDKRVDDPIHLMMNIVAHGYLYQQDKDKLWFTLTLNVSIELEPENLTALQIRAQTDYEKCAFERALVLSHRGMRLRRLPPDFAECVRHAEETVRECTGKSSNKILSDAVSLIRLVELKRESIDSNILKVPVRQSRMKPLQTQQVQEISRAQKHRTDQISRLMASKYLERMAHDKYFLTALCKDERLVSANKQGSQKLQELANKALRDVEKREAVLRERRPLYAARALEEDARARLSQTRKEQLTHAQQQHITDSQRLIIATQSMLEKRDTTKCIENAEFAMEQISRKPATLLPGKEKFMHQLYNIVADAFLDQKRVRETMSESDREKRAFVLLGMALSREPSHDSVLRVRPPAPPRDSKKRLRNLERALSMSTRAAERCYLLHELARLLVDTKKALRARFYAFKCQSDARASNHRVWLLNALFLLARCHLLQHNRPEARAVLLEGAGLARSYGFNDVAAFFDTCVDVSLEGEVLSTEAPLEKREKAMVSLMQDDDLRSAAKHLFKRMSVIPASRRFSVMPGTRVEDTGRPTLANRRQSIIPRSEPTRITHKLVHPLGFQEFDA